MQGKASCKMQATATVFILIPDCPQKAEKDCHVEAEKQNSKPTEPPKAQQTQIRQSPASRNVSRQDNDPHENPVFNFLRGQGGFRSRSCGWAIVNLQCAPRQSISQLSLLCTSCHTSKLLIQNDIKTQHLSKHIS